MTDGENQRILDLPLTRQGNSLGVSVPRKILNRLGLEHGDWVRVVLTKRESDK